MFRASEMIENKYIKEYKDSPLRTATLYNRSRSPTGTLFDSCLDDKLVECDYGVKNLYITVALETSF